MICYPQPRDHSFLNSFVFYKLSNILDSYSFMASLSLPIKYLYISMRLKFPATTLTLQHCHLTCIISGFCISYFIRGVSNPQLSIATLLSFQCYVPTSSAISLGPQKIATTDLHNNWKVPLLLPLWKTLCPPDLQNIAGEFVSLMQFIQSKGPTSLIPFILYSTICHLSFELGISLRAINFFQPSRAHLACQLYLLSSFSKCITCIMGECLPFIQLF